MPRGPPGMDQACAAGMGQAWASGDGSGVGLGQWIRRLAHGDTGMPRGSTSTLACVEAWVKTAVQPMCRGRPPREGAWPRWPWHVDAGPNAVRPQKVHSSSRLQPPITMRGSVGRAAGGRMPRGPLGDGSGVRAASTGSGRGRWGWVRRLAHGDTGMPRGSTSTLACVEAWVKTAVQPMCHGRPRVRRNPRASRIISRRGRNENEGVVDCESLRLRVSARVGLSFHTFSRPCRKRSAT